MLVEKTTWLKRYDIWFRSRQCHDNQTLCICYDGLKRVFDIPPDVAKVRFYVYDKPTKNSAEFKLHLNWSGVAFVMFTRYTQMPLWDYLPDKRIRELLSKQKHYYVECEYVN